MPEAYAEKFQTFPRSVAMLNAVYKVAAAVLTFWIVDVDGIYLWYGPLPVTVTTRIITLLVGDPYKPLFATVTVRGDNPIFTLSPIIMKWKITLNERKLILEGPIHFSLP